MNKSLRIIGIYYIGSVFDSITTYIGVFKLGGTELNPFVLAVGWVPAAIIKMLFVPIICYYLLRLIEKGAELGYPHAGTCLKLSWLFPVQQWLAVAWNTTQIALLLGWIMV